MSKEILDDPSPNNSRDDFWDDIKRKEEESSRKITNHLERKRVQILHNSKISHINVCKRALYVALLNLPTDAYSDSDANIGIALSKDPYIQNLLDEKKGE